METLFFYRSNSNIRGYELECWNLSYQVRYIFGGTVLVKLISAAIRDLTEISAITQAPVIPQPTVAYFPIFS